MFHGCLQGPFGCIAGQIQFGAAPIPQMGVRICVIALSRGQCMDVAAADVEVMQLCQIRNVQGCHLGTGQVQILQVFTAGEGNSQVRPRL